MTTGRDSSSARQEADVSKREKKAELDLGFANKLASRILEDMDYSALEMEYLGILFVASYIDCATGY